MENRQCPRQDLAMARSVDEGIAIDRAAGAANAWVYMQHHAIPAGIITRVLAYPALRRRNDKIPTEILQK
ncbi:MAG: hypothetical protein V4724_18590 [Pseudomonadota bacterium]